MKLDTPTKIAALIALVAYVAGVLTVGIYVQHNDIPAPDLTVFKAHYIYTGIEVLGLLAAAAALISLCLLIAERVQRPVLAPGGGGRASRWPPCCGSSTRSSWRAASPAPKPLRALWLVS